jgi:TrmH family RNA methyltransferase
MLAFGPRGRLIIRVDSGRALFLDPASVDIVLLRPARPANVALACRAMKAMGLRQLVLAGPSGGLEAREVRALAYGAWDVLDGARRAVSLEEAVRDSVLVVGTSGRIREGEVFSPRRLAEEGASRSQGGRTSIVFGPEATGLSRGELEVCHATLQISTHPDQPSLNLAQAVLVVAYELRIAALTQGGMAGRAAAGGRAAEGSDEARATAGDLQEALAEFATAAVGIGYLNPQDPGHLLAEWRRLFARAAPSRREVTLLRGLARQMAFAAAEIARTPRRAR